MHWNHLRIQKSLDISNILKLSHTSKLNLLKKHEDNKGL